MKMRMLGQTGLLVTPLGFGAAPIGGHYGDMDFKAQVTAVRHAIDRGINLIDTSPYYSETRSESLLGEALAGSYRDRVVLTTKAGRNGLADFDFSAAGMLRSLDASLKRLRTDHVDIWFAHDIEFATDLEIYTETADALCQAKQAGKCRFVGVTGYPPELLLQVLDYCERCDLDVALNYCHFSLANTWMVSSLLPYAGNVGMLNASALMMGLFSSKGPPPWHPAPESLKERCAEVRELCVSRGASPEILALQFALQEERIASTLVGMSSIAEVDMNLRAAVEPLDPNLLADVLTILEPVRDMEWPSGNWPVRAQTRPRRSDDDKS